MAYRHSRTPSTSSEVLASETVSYVQRWFFANIFRSQRHMVRFCVGITVFILIMYTINPFGSPENDSPLKTSAESNPRTVATRSVSEEKIRPSDSEYRATYFEEMGKRFARKNMTKLTDFHATNDLRKEEKDDVETPASNDDLTNIVVKVKKMALVVSKCQEVPGMSIVLVKGQDSAKIPLGIANVETKHSVTPNTKFVLNSISKTFLGQLLAVIISDPKKNVSWDTHVADILGSEFHLTTEELTREVTVRDLLSHRTGLSSGNLGVRATFPSDWTVADVVKNLKHLPASAAFRSTFLYSNLASMLTVHITEKLGGAPWDKLMVKRLLEPLGMTQAKAVTSVSQMQGNDYSGFYVPLEGKVVPADMEVFDLGPLFPLAHIAVTASDMAKWLRFNLACGHLPDGQQLIDSHLWSSMWSRHIHLSPMFLAGVDKSADYWPVKDLSEGYGLYWFINKYRGLTNYWHGGGLYTHYTLAWHFPERDVALYVVINGYSSHSKPFSVVESIAYYAADLLLGFEPWLNETSACTYPKPWARGASRINNSNGKINKSAGVGEKEKNSALHGSKSLEKKDKMIGLASFPLEVYQGIFHNPLFGNFSVSLNPKTKVLECHMRTVTGILHLNEGHTFGVELTKHLRFLSKPSEDSPAKDAFWVTFVEGKPGGLTDVDVHSFWAMEVPIRFYRIR